MNLFRALPLLVLPVMVKSKPISKVFHDSLPGIPKPGLDAQKPLIGDPVHTVPSFQECFNKLSQDIFQAGKETKCNPKDIVCLYTEIENKKPQLLDKQSSECQKIFNVFDQIDKVG